MAKFLKLKKIDFNYKLLQLKIKNQIKKLIIIIIIFIFFNIIIKMINLKLKFLFRLYGKLQYYFIQIVYRI